MRWIREHKLISVLLMALLILSVIFGVSVISGGEGNGFTGVINKGVSAVSGGLSSAAKAIRDNVTGIFSYKSLQEEIDRLEEENQQLKKELAEVSLDRQDLEQLENLSKALDFEYTDKEFKLAAADITSLDGSNWTNVFTIDRGTESGIEKGDAVVNGMGLVGRIQETGKGWSKVVSLIDENCDVSFKLVRDRKQLGIVSGSEGGGISGYMMDAESTVSEGDIIITSGLGIYPEGLYIGNVKNVTYNSNTLMKEITVEPAVNFKGLEKVAVII